MAKTPESKVKDTINESLAPHPHVVINQATWGQGKSGHGDKVVCLYGAFVMIEAKAGKNKPTELQKMRLRETVAAGGIAMVINESNSKAVTTLALMLQIAHEAGHRYNGPQVWLPRGFTLDPEIQDIPLED